MENFWTMHRSRRFSRGRKRWGAVISASRSAARSSRKSLFFRAGAGTGTDSFDCRMGLARRAGPAHYSFNCHRRIRPFPEARNHHRAHGRDDSILSGAHQCGSDAVYQAEENCGGLLSYECHITTSGIFTAPPFNLALEVVRADRILFSVDYPYSSNEQGRAFLDKLSIAPADFEKITHTNAERLLKL